jgi:hypothetical protein
LSTLQEADNWIVSAFEQRSVLVKSLAALGGGCSGLDGFKEKWSALVERGGAKAAAAMATAAHDTTKELERMKLLDLLSCAYECGSPPHQKKVKFPVLGVIVPELGSWNLAPCNDPGQNQELYNIFERECPEIANEEGDPTSDIVIEENSWKLFLQNGKLCTLPDDGSGRDMSLQLQVRNEEMSANTLRNSAIRMHMLAIFLSHLVKYAKGDECSVCGMTGDALKRCQKCRCGIYCSRDCQVKAFHDAHKKECKVLRQLQERYANDTPFPEHDLLGAYMALQSFLYGVLKEAVIPKVIATVDEKVKTAHPEMKRIKGAETVSEEEIVNFM